MGGSRGAHHTTPHHTYRHTAPPAELMVLVTRSGIDASRLAPRSLSVMKPETIGR